MTPTVITNTAVFRSIADEAFDEMTERVQAGRREKPDGTPGFILTYDPQHTAFKQATISIVFTGIWLESLLHLLMVDMLGKASADKHDRKKYEEKLQLLGVADENLLKQVRRFRTIRRELVHEKAYTDNGEIRVAETEAKNSRDLRAAIDAWLQTR